MALSKKHRALLDSITNPQRRSADLKWRDLRGLLQALGAEIDESRRGSRISIRIGSEVIALHLHGQSARVGKKTQEGIARFLSRAADGS